MNVNKWGDLFISPYTTDEHKSPRDGGLKKINEQQLVNILTGENGRVLFESFDDDTACLGMVGLKLEI